jgi:cytolysin-activating lysine-acyltransferase
VSDVDRVVQQLQVSTVGGIVTPAQQLMVVPAENRLEIEAMAQNKDIGFIEAGHRPRSRSTPSTARSTGCCTAPCSMLRNTRSPRDKPVGKDKSGSRSRRARGGPSTISSRRSYATNTRDCARDDQNDRRRTRLRVEPTPSVGRGAGPPKGSHCRMATDLPEEQAMSGTDQDKTGTNSSGASPAANGGATGWGSSLPVTNDAAFGEAVWLMMNTPMYRHVFLADLEWMVLPPILLRQFRVFFNEGRTVAFAAWAYLSAATEARLQEPNPRLSPQDWKSGDRLWLVNMFAPFGHGEIALKELKGTALSGKNFRMHRIDKDGTRTIRVIN